MLPIPVKKAIEQFGQDIRDSRRRRRIPISIMAERASVSRITIGRIEKGEPSVALGTYATVLYILGMIDRFSELVDVKKDVIGLELEEELLPKRIRKSKKLSNYNG